MVTRREFLIGSAAAVGAFLVPRSAYAAVPDISLYTEGGEQKQLHSFFGKPLLLHFWATWCKPCIEDIPVLNDMSSQITVLGLMEVAPNTLERELAKLQTIKASSPMAFGNYLLYPEDQAKYARVMPDVANLAPVFSLLDSQGNHVHGQTGALKYEDRLKTLQKAVAGVR